MALCALALTAAPALAAPTSASVDSINAFYTSAHITATVHADGGLPGSIGETYWRFDYSSDEGQSWVEAPGEAHGGPIPIDGEQTFQADFTELKPATKYLVRVGYYNATTNEGGVSLQPDPEFTTLTVTAPIVTADTPTFTATTAHLSGSVTAGNADPAFDSSCRFDYVKKAQFQVDGFASAQTTACNPATVIGAASTPVQADLSGLDPGFEYVIQLVASNQGGTGTSAPEEFATPVSAPAVTTAQASDRTSTAARLNGTLRAFGKQTSYHFEYGLTTSYGSQVPLDHEGVGGIGYGPLAVSQPIAGLQPGTTYHFRLVAHSELGESFGADQTFTTVPDSPLRAFELVSPADKGGIDVGNLYSGASTDGNRFAFSTGSALAGAQSSTAAPLAPFYGAMRNGTDWTSRALDAPQQAVGFRQRLLATLAISSDGTKAVTISPKALAPGAVEGDSNIYLEDTATGAMTTMGTTPGTGFYEAAGYPPSLVIAYVAGTPDFSHVLFNSEGYVFKPGAPAGALYEFTNGQLRVASVQPDGSPFPDVVPQSNLIEHDTHRISDDGSHVFFEAPDGLYVRIDGTHTELISESQRSTDPPGTARGAAFLSASSDGNVVFFLSTNLTDDSAPGANTLYRYVLSSHTLTRIGETFRPEFFMQASADGAYAYFITESDLGDGGSSGAGQRNFYVWHAGTLHRIATLDQLSAFFFSSYRASPNGRYLVFASVAALSGTGVTSTAPTPHQEVYRYDAETDQLDCASCPPDGSSPTSDAALGETNAEVSHHFPRNVLDDGRVFFTTNGQLAAADTNQVNDVYEYDGEQPKLISSGSSGAPSVFLDATPDGRDVFFTTKDQLVGIDIDTQRDVYDARLGGGLASQNPPAPRQECIRDDCKATPSAGPELPFGGSEGLNGPENVKGTPARKRCAKGTHARKVKGKSRCVKQDKKPGKKRTDNNRRQAR